MAAAIEVIISVEAATVTVLSMDGNLLFIEEQEPSFIFQTYLNVGYIGFRSVKQIYIKKNRSDRSDINVFTVLLTGENSAVRDRGLARSEVTTHHSD